MRRADCKRPKGYFTEDGGEFNQIGSNLAMICATFDAGLGSGRGRNRNSGQIAPVGLNTRQNAPKCARAAKTGRAS
jgi:hypothetical protein